MHFTTFEDLSNSFKNKIVNKEEFIQSMKSYFTDYLDVIERKDVIIFTFDDFDIKIILKKLTDNKHIKILDIKHC